MVVGLFLFVAVVFVIAMTYGVYKATEKQYRQALYGLGVALVPTFFLLQDRFYAEFFKWLDTVPPGWGIL